MATKLNEIQIRLILDLAEKIYLVWLRNNPSVDPTYFDTALVNAEEIVRLERAYALTFLERLKTI